MKKENLEHFRRRVERLRDVLLEEEPCPAKVGSVLGLVLLSALPYCEEHTFWFFAKEMAAERKTILGCCRECGESLRPEIPVENEYCPACAKKYEEEEFSAED